MSGYSLLDVIKAAWADRIRMTRKDAFELLWAWVLAVLFAFAVPILVGLVGSWLATRAQAHDHAALGKVGEFYAGWKRPDMRMSNERYASCCNEDDCAVTQIVRKGGQWFARDHKLFPGQDILIPDELLESNQGDPRESPDGQSHVCISKWTGKVLCAVLGSGG